MAGEDRDYLLSGLMVKTQNGDREAYSDLLLKITEILTPFFLRRLVSSEAASDVAQETLISIHTARHTYDPGKPFLPWMYAIARRRLIDYWRRQERHLACEPLETIEQTEAEPKIESASDIVNEALAELAPHDRDVIRFLKVEGRSIKEVAKLMNITESAAKVRAHRAYQRLRQRFEALDDGYERNN